jgi:hypothetical protein
MSDQIAYSELLPTAASVAAGLVSGIPSGGAERQQLLDESAQLAVRFATALIVAAKAATSA